MGKRKYHKSKSLLSPTDYSVYKEVRKVKKKTVLKKKKKKVVKGKSKSIVYQRKQKQKQPRQKQSQSIVVHIHPKKSKPRNNTPRFKNYSHEKAQKYFSSHYQTMGQSRAGYSLYNSLKVKKVIDALTGDKDRAAELRAFYVEKYGAQMAPKVKSIGTSTEPEEMKEPHPPQTPRMVLSRSPRRIRRRTDFSFSDDVNVSSKDWLLKNMLKGISIDGRDAAGNYERDSLLKKLSVKDLRRRAALFGVTESNAGYATEEGYYSQFKGLRREGNKTGWIDKNRSLG